MSICPESTPEDREAYDRWHDEGGGAAFEPLHVVQAAIMKHGVMFTMPRPFRHVHIVRGMSRVLPPNSGDEQGFVLSDGTFATRQHAALIAYRAAQLSPNYTLTGLSRLYTGDLW